MYIAIARYVRLFAIPFSFTLRLHEQSRAPSLAFRTKPQIALSLIEHAGAAAIPFEAIVADSAYGDNPPFVHTLTERHLPYVLAHSGTASRGRAPEDVAHTFEDAARDLPVRAWQRIVRRFRDGHAERWWAAELQLFHYGPDRPVRAVCVTTDRRELPELSTWYLTTTLPMAQASVTEVARLYGLRNWIEQGYKQMKDELGWANFMVRSDRAIRRHWTLVCCAFAFCWWHEAAEVRLHDTLTLPAREKNPVARAATLAAPVAGGARLADASALAHTLLASVLRQAPAATAGRIA